jgi:hypothetical protein
MSIFRKIVQAIHPRTGEWEEAEQLDRFHKVGLNQSDKEWVATVEFEDGTKVEQPAYFIED